MDEPSQEAIFARSLKAAAAATAGSSVSRQVVRRKPEDRGSQAALGSPDALNAGPPRWALPAFTEENERQARIERLRRQIASGEYDRNAAEVSKRMIDDHLAG